MAKGREKKPHIGIFGKRNSGKSTLINMITGQDIAIVSDYAGTTTDPVKKSVEIKGIGASVVVDTAGIDDTGELGGMRIKKTKNAMKQVDLALLIFTNNNFGEFENSLVNDFQGLAIPFLIIHNKSDLNPISPEVKSKVEIENNATVLDFSALNPKKPEEIFNAIKKTLPPTAYVYPSLLGDLVTYGSVVLLIVPIDEEAPQGRLILPQVQTIRDILDNDCVSIVLKEREVDAFLRKTKIRPDLVITDSSIFLKADASIPRDIPLTGFSILLARFKGEFEYYLKGTPEISNLNNDDHILLLESCTHQTSCDDIGRVKIPRWITNFTGKDISFDVVAGFDELKRPITDYAMVIQCGGCMVTKKQLSNRLKPAIDAGVPVSNYGMVIAYVQGIYNRAISPFVKVESDTNDYL